MDVATANLTAKQARWVDEYLACGDASASAVKAGFSQNGAGVAGNRMLKNAYVQKALHERQTADATRLSLRREDVLNGLLEAVATAKERLDPSAMVAAWKQVAHMMGYFSPERIKVDLDVAGSVEMGRLSALSDAELLNIITAERTAAQ
jgi:phage terminase small subunit